MPVESDCRQSLGNPAHSGPSAGRLYYQAALLFAGIFALLVLTHPGFDNSEAGYHYLVSQQIVQHAVISFEAPQDGPFIVAPNGRTYAAHELGNSIALIPVAILSGAIQHFGTKWLGSVKVALANRFLFAMMGPLLCGATCFFLFLTLRAAFAQSVQMATVNVILCCFCSFYWTYSRSIFDGVLCSTLLSAAMFFLFCYVRDSTRLAMLVAAFFCLGFGIATRLSMIIPVIASFVYLGTTFATSNFPRLKKATCLAVGTLVPFVGWQLFYNHLRTGNAFVSPGLTAKYASEIGLSGNILLGATGLLFSPGKSIFVYCPAALLSIFLFATFWRRYRNEAVFVATLCVLWLALHSRLQSWYGSWGWGPRHFITIVPALVLPFLVVRSETRSRAFHYLEAVFLSFGFVLAAASVITNYHYRLALAAEAHRNSDGILVWSLAHNQAMDVLASACRNIHRVIFGGAYEVLPHASQIDVMGSNTLNLWLFTAHGLEVPAVALAAVAVFLIACSGSAFWILLRNARFSEGTLRR